MAERWLLATSVPQYDVRMDMRAEGLTDALFTGHIDSLSWCLSQLFQDRSPAEYRRDLVSARDRRERYYLVKRNVDHDQLKTLRAFPLYRLGRSKAGLVIDGLPVRLRLAASDRIDEPAAPAALAGCVDGAYWSEGMDWMDLRVGALLDRLAGELAAAAP